MTGDKRGQEGSRARDKGDDGWAGLRTRGGKQESLRLYLYISYLNYTKKAIGGSYIIMALIFIGSFLPNPSQGLCHSMPRLG